MALVVLGCDRAVLWLLTRGSGSVNFCNSFETPGRFLDHDGQPSDRRFARSLASNYQGARGEISLSENPCMTGRSQARPIAILPTELSRTGPLLIAQ
jgi:hypothetical protein